MSKETNQNETAAQAQPGTPENPGSAYSGQAEQSNSIPAPDTIPGVSERLIQAGISFTEAYFINNDGLLPSAEEVLFGAELILEAQVATILLKKLLRGELEVTLKHRTEGINPTDFLLRSAGPGIKPQFTDYDTIQTGARTLNK